jgi:hypothetical protein
LPLKIDIDMPMMGPMFRASATPNGLTRASRGLALGLAACALSVVCATASAEPGGYWSNWHAYRVVSVRFTASADTVDYDPDTGAVAFRDSQTTTIRVRPGGNSSFGYNGDITVPISGQTSGTQSSYYTEGAETGAETGSCSYRFNFKGRDSMQVDFTRQHGTVQTSFIPVTNEGGYCNATAEAEAPNWHLPNQVSVPMSRFSGNTIVLGTSGSYDAGKGSSLGHTDFTWSLAVRLARR